MSSDLPSIEDLLLATLDAVSRFRVGQREAAGAALDAGALLTEAKGRLQHGEWGDWLHRVGLAPRTASTWMKLAGMDLTAEDVIDRGGINSAARGVKPESASEADLPGSVDRDLAEAVDPARVAVARIALLSATIIVGECDEGWPFPGVGSTFALCDADAYAYPYGAIRAFWKRARKADAVGLLGTDAQMMPQNWMHARWHHPDGHTVHNPLPRDRSRTRATYWVRLIKPWLSALVAPDGYSITMTKRFERAGMHYWGAVAER